jgi:hypothetical protein
VLTTVRQGYSPLMGSSCILRHKGPKSKASFDYKPPSQRRCLDVTHILKFLSP